MGVAVRDPRHAVGDLVAAALVGDAPEDWLRLAAGLSAVAPSQGGALAFVALSALPDTAAMDVIDAYATGAGWPLPPFAVLAHEARMWAAEASPRELKFYAWAVVERLGRADRQALAAKIAKIEASVPPDAAGGGGAR